MKSAAAILVALFLTAPVNAQFTNCTANGPFLNCFGTDGTITNCSRTGNTLNCHSMGGQNGQSYNDSGASAAAGIVDLVRSINERKARSRVNKALDAGDCTTAAQQALKANSPELARLVLARCAGE